MGQEDRNSGCDAGIGPHRKAGREDEVLDSTLNRVQVRCQLEKNRTARVLLAIACMILSEFSMACLEPFPPSRKSGVNA